MNLILLENSASTQVLAANSAAAIHLKNVLKVTAGTTFWCGEKDGKRGIATVEKIHGNGEISLKISWEKAVPAEMKLPPIRLLVGLSRPQTMKKIFASAAELGCEEIAIFVSENSDRAYEKSKIFERGNAEIFEIFKKSAEQTCSTFFPKFRFFKTLEEALESEISEEKSSPRERQIFVLDVYEKSAKPFFEAVFTPAEKENRARENSKIFTLAIGSERGWTNREREIFRTKNAEFFYLGARILRVENAASAALAVALSKIDFWRSRHAPIQI